MTNWRSRKWINCSIPINVTLKTTVEVTIDLDEVIKLLEQDKQEIANLEAKINEQLRILGVNV
ncbi:hypothetical protein J43TS9_56280 [Paenibacillus cineris]|nr:hypothetical protein J43TS9_56280 [Paenibacillus cineris]